MKLTPSLHKTIVSGLKKEEVINQISGNTQIVNAEYIIDGAAFNGNIQGDHFRISLVTHVAQNSLPLAVGHVENTSLGSIIFIEFRLFPAALLYIQFSTLLCILCALVFLFLAKFITAAIIAGLIALLNYTILTINFHRKVPEVYDRLSHILVGHN